MLAGCLLAVVPVVGLALVPAAQAAGPAANISLMLSSSTLTADGISTVTATASVTDASSSPVPGETVMISSSDTGESISPKPAHDNGDGTYTATITSSTKAGPVTITAADTSTPGIAPATQPLTQIAGRATQISLGLNPTSVPADGTSTSLATATVADANGNPVSSDNVVISSADPTSATTPRGNGQYTATVTSSTTPGSVAVNAGDQTTNITATPQTLTQTSLPPQNISLTVRPTSIVANRASKATATAIITDRLGKGVGGQTVSFQSSDPGESISSTSYKGNGHYTALITSSTAVGPATIRATDPALPGGQQTALQTLTQTVGPPTSITVSLNPPTLLANGIATSTATATVTDSAGHGLSGQAVTITSPGENISPVTDQGNGNYTATISSTTLGLVTITATDKALPGGQQTSQASLNQVALTSATTLVISPASPPETNQGVTLIATINPQQGAFAAGTMDFFAGPSPLPGCTGLPVSSSTPIAACPASFAAASSPVPLLAVFTPNLASNVAGSSATASLTVVKGSTITSVAPSSFTPTVGGRETFTATVVPNPSGATAPTGSVEFEQGGRPIGSCSSVALSPGGTASCTVKYRSPGTHHITAVYSGNVNFNGSTSGSHTITVGAHGHVPSFVQWLFSYHPGYTTVASLQVSGVPVGANVLVTCMGRGCPYTRRMTTLHRGFRCTRSGRHKCGSPGPVNLGTTFRRHHLAVGTTIIVEIRRPGFVGKFYRFTIRAGRGPMVHILCLAPGLNKPGVACTL